MISVSQSKNHGLTPKKLKEDSIVHFWTLVFDNGCPRQILDVFILMINKSENNANITHITTGRIGLLWVLLESLTIVYLRTQSSDLRRIVEFLTLLSNFGRYHLISNSIFRLRISKSAFGRYRLISPKTSLRRHLFVNWNVLLLLETFLFPPEFHWLGLKSGNVFWLFYIKNSRP